MDHFQLKTCRNFTTSPQNAVQNDRNIPLGCWSECFIRMFRVFLQEESFTSVFHASVRTWCLQRCSWAADEEQECWSRYEHQTFPPVFPEQPSWFCRCSLFTSRRSGREKKRVPLRSTTVVWFETSSCSSSRPALQIRSRCSWTRRSSPLWTSCVSSEARGFLTG